jgi:ribosomal protein L11 methyltransferase
MQWLEILLRVPREQGDAIADILQSFGHQGVSITHEGIPPDRFDDDEIPPPPFVAVRVYIPDDHRAPDAKAQIEGELAPLGVTPIYTLMDDQDWADAWKKHYHPTRIGRHIVIRPLWEEATDLQPEDIVVALDPGMAFGTGTHPTTQLCLAALEDAVQPAVSVLDLGCGSGILAIAAAKLGAGKILAVDIDPIAIEATIQNAEQNGTSDKIVAQEGDLQTVLTSARRFDILVANILARTIIEMCSTYPLGDVVRPGGIGIFSGIMTLQVADVEAALQNVGLTLVRVRQEGDWVALETVRPIT